MNKDKKIIITGSVGQNLMIELQKAGFYNIIALVTDDHFELIPWWDIFDVKPMGLAVAYQLVNVAKF